MSDVSSQNLSTTLRLVWPQWQGAGPEVVRILAPELDFEDARRGYFVGSQVLNAVLPPHDGPTVVVPVEVSDPGVQRVDGIHAKEVLARQLGSALAILDEHRPERVLTLGGECSVSVAPFAELARRYGDDLAIVWIDANPDIGTPESDYGGYHAMALSVLTGHGDASFVGQLPALVEPSHIAIAGVHAWNEDDHPNAAAWGIREFSPEDLRESSDALVTWLEGTGCSKVAIHLDVDVVDSNEIVLGLGADPDGLTGTEVRRVVADIRMHAEVVGLTIAEFVPRQVIALRRLLDGMPLIT